MISEFQPFQIIYADFIVEHSDIQPLDHRIVKKFTSLAKNPIPSAHIYDPTIFRWNFGDGTPIVETGDRTIYHIYEHPGKYLVRHQACNFCTCSDWNMCYKKIKVKHEDHNHEEDEDHNHEDDEDHDHEDDEDHDHEDDEEEYCEHDNNKH